MGDLGGGRHEILPPPASEEQPVVYRSHLPIVLDDSWCWRRVITHIRTVGVHVRSVRECPLSGDLGKKKRVGAVISGTSLPKVSAHPDHHDYHRCGL